MISYLLFKFLIELNLRTYTKLYKKNITIHLIALTNFGFSPK